MGQTPTKNSDFFSSGLSDEDLARILAHIDKDIEIRLNQSDKEKERRPLDLPSRSALPEMAQLASLLVVLRARKTPLFVMQGLVMSKIAWLINLPLRLFLRKQIIYNDDILNALDFIVHQLYSLGDYQSELNPIKDSITHLTSQIEKSEKQNEATPVDNELKMQLKKIEEELKKTNERLELIEKK